MPYPASPPTPPTIAAPAGEETRYSQLPADSGLASPVAVFSHSQARSALPETAAFDLPNQATVADFAQQASQSRANRLGTVTSAGYLLKNDRPSREIDHSAITPSQPASSTFNPLNRPLLNRPLQTQPPQRFTTYVESTSLAGSGWKRQILPPSSHRFSNPPPPHPVLAAPPSVYSLSGLVTSPNLQEADVVAGLNQAIVIDPLLSATTASQALNLVAQTANGPLVLPISPTDSAIPGSTDSPSTAPTPLTQPTPAPQQTVPSAVPAPSAGGVIEVSADRQDFDQQRQIFTAEGKVKMRFQNALLDADRVQVNLVNRVTVAEGNVALTRGDQVLRGQRFEYNFVQGIGTVQRASGVIYLPTTGTDLAFPAAGGADEGVTLNRPVSDRVTINQPVGQVSSPGGFSTSIGAGRNVGRVPGALPRGGEVRRLRFEAETIDFTPEGWTAQNIQITNDPFSPPELVLKANQATLTRVSPLSDEVRATRPRLVFDQRLSIPLLASRLVLDRNERPPALLEFGYDDIDRGGFFARRTFDVLRSKQVRLTLSPQIFLQRMISGTGNPFDPSNYGAIARLSVIAGPRTSIRGRIAFNSFDPDEIGDTLRASLRARQLVGTHTLGLEYSYRDRLFNGSLGFQTVQSSLGILLTSPVIALGKTGFNLTYQGGYQYINAATDRLNLLDPIRENNRINLSRYQASAALSRGFLLWQGTALPATATEGLRYSPTPIVPYVLLNTRIEGVFSGYSSGESQQNLIARVGLFGQFGHFSRRFFDYTAFNLTYTQFIGSGQSPFLFDRTVDNRILSVGIIQQIYGPIRAGFQTSLSLDNSNNQISTDYILEYSRRTYALTLRYNAVLGIGSLSFRVSDFNWTGGSQPFSGFDITPVEGGIRRGEESY